MISNSLPGSGVPQCRCVQCRQKMTKLAKRLCRKEFLLEAVQAMHATLTLRGRAADLETEVSRIEHVAEHVERAGTDVLEAMLHALNEIWDVPVQGALVLNSPNDTLSDFHSGVVSKVSII